MIRNLGDTRSAGARRVGEGFDALPRPSWTSHPPPQTTRVATLDPWGFAKLIMQPQVQDHILQYLFVNILSLLRITPRKKASSPLVEGSFFGSG